VVSRRDITVSDTLSYHPLANIFPLLEGEEFDALVEDIRQHGQRAPIVPYQKQILDGRNRHRACLEAGIACWLEEYDGDDPLAFVVSLNLKRRHLSTSQRAMIGARLATLKTGQRADLVQAPSIEEAAKLLNVGHASIERAKTVLGEGEPELVAAVESGEISVSGAVESIRRGINTGVAMLPYAERGHELYETPPAAVSALLAVETLRGVIWEPACGPGAIVNVLRERAHRVIATDLIDYGCPEATGGVDFLQQRSAPEGVTTILTNPPFMHADPFVRHALTLAPRVIMLLRLLFLEGQGRSDIVDGERLARVYVFRDRVPIHRHGHPGPHQSSPLALSWFVWEREHRGPIELRRVSCDSVFQEQRPEPHPLDIPTSLRRVAP
jgi:hypothetical protein